MATKLFGDVDRNKDGNIQSEYPAFYYETHKEELEETIRQREYALDHDMVEPSERGIQKERLAQEKDKLAKVNEATPQLSGAELDDMAKVRSDIGRQISESMFKRSDMEKGVADAHEEARRMSSPVMEVKSKAQAEMLEACGVKLGGRTKVTRTEMEKVWKITGKVLSESTNTEVLRKG